MQPKLNQNFTLDILAVVMIWDASRDGSPGSLMKLEGHQLTVIQIIFNQSSDRILTVGRDRIAIIWKLDGNEWVKEQVFGKGRPLFSNPLNTHTVYVTYRILKPFLEQNGHSRIIWNGCWSKNDNETSFYTVGRDKLLIKWKLNSEGWCRSQSMQFDESVTAIDSTTNSEENNETIVVGLERKSLE